MHITKIFEEKKTVCSFEFFPPKSEEASKGLFQAIKELIPLRPAYVSVTYGAGGSSRKHTRELISKIQKETDLTVVAHLTCVGHSRFEMREILDSFAEAGVQNILALKGDLPQNDKNFSAQKNEFNYAGDLVAFIKKHAPHMGIGVAGFPEGHPKTPNRLQEMDYLKWKVDQGADYICTQLFFDNHDFYDFQERCELAGIHIPIVAGIMPITSRKSIKRMSELALGARFPAKLLVALSRASDDLHAESVGIHWATEQLRDLLDHGTRGIHFYTLNKSKASKEIYHALGLKNADSLNLLQSSKAFFSSMVK